MDEKIIFIYCFCSDFLKSLQITDDPQSKMNSAEIMTFGIVSALFFGGNCSRTRLLLNNPRYMRNMLSNSRLNRRLHAMDISVWQSAFYVISLVLSKNSHLEYLIDSMPVEVFCQC